VKVKAAEALTGRPFAIDPGGVKIVEAWRVEKLASARTGRR